MVGLNRIYWPIPALLHNRVFSFVQSERERERQADTGMLYSLSLEEYRKYRIVKDTITNLYEYSLVVHKSVYITLCVI